MHPRTNLPAAPARLRDRPEYLTVREAAIALGLSKSRTYELIQTGRLRAVRDGFSSTRYVHIDELRRLTNPQPAPIVEDAVA